jgi:UDP-3-O-[3-hydroxymyristoyl] N-acetylglucosamine deacetylase
MAGLQLGAQTTLRGSAVVSGIGVHTGHPVSLTLHPADIDSGIVFVRTGADGRRDREIAAHVSQVSATDLCTTIGVNDSSVGTIEHLMAALRALDIDNVLVEIDGPEVPVMDGSAKAFIDAIDEVGAAVLAAPRRYVRVLKPVRVELGRSVAEFRPHNGMRVEVEIDFANPVVGRQVFAAEIDGEVFRRDVARARTFGFLADIEQLWSRGLALGASLDNAVVIGEDRIINPEGLRYADECVRHKVLDSIGDLALIGAPLLGTYRSTRGGHRLNVMAVQALLADEEAWTFAEASVRREGGHADLAAGVGVAAFGPNVA